MFYVGKGATGEDNKIARARAIQEAIGKREFLSLSDEVRQMTQNTTADMKAIVNETVELHRFFNRPINQVMESIVVDLDIPPLLKKVMLNSLLEE